jgi:hypothetical protein
MALSNELVDEIENIIGAIPSNVTSNSSVDDIYEVYLFTLVLLAAQREGAVIRLRNLDNTNPSKLHFRTSPGYIASQRRSYTYAEILFGSKPSLEAHVSIMVSGHSHVLHECDVCVLLQSEADFCRRSLDRVAPRSSKVILNIEAKFYTTPLSLGLGRSFLGLTTDLSSQGSFLVTNTSSSSIEKLLSYKKKSWEHNVKPNNQAELGRLIPSFQNIFKDFKAKN